MKHIGKGAFLICLSLVAYTDTSDENNDSELLLVHVIDLGQTGHPELRCLQITLCYGNVAEGSTFLKSPFKSFKVFRHGERTTYRFYPTDPYINETFYPIGLGGLTNKGKLMMYKLGEFLKKGYGSFLGDDYQEGKLAVRSTDSSRTRMSALLVLAGLWLPSERQRWNPTLMWQPIPVFAKPLQEEDLISSNVCKLRNQIVNNLSRNPAVYQTYIEPNKQLFKYIEGHSGSRIRDFIDLVNFYFILKSEADYGLKLPEWTKSIYPEPLHSVAALVYEYTNYDTTARKIQIGYLIQKILNDSLAKADDTLKPSQRKMFLYSGHESTLGNLLQALKVFKREVPPYGSAIIFELHKQKEDYSLKIKHLKNPDNPTIEELTIPNCDTLCPIHRFLDLQTANENLPTTDFNTACNIDQAMKN